MGEDQSLPVLDSAALKVLEDEAGESASRRFVEEYLLMLPTRAAKVLKGLAGEDLEPANRALISLRVTSAMAGALRLEGFCDDLERALERGEGPATVSVKRVLFANIRLVVYAAAWQGYFPTGRYPQVRSEGPSPRYEDTDVEALLLRNNTRSKGPTAVSFKRPGPRPCVCSGRSGPIGIGMQNPLP